MQRDDPAMRPTASPGQAYSAASATLNDWITGAQAMAVREAAVGSGLLAVARTPHTLAQRAVATGLDQERVANLCLALDAHGMLTRVEETYRLTSDFVTLTAVMPTLLIRVQ